MEILNLPQLQINSLQCGVSQLTGNKPGSDQWGGGEPL